MKPGINSFEQHRHYVDVSKQEEEPRNLDENGVKAIKMAGRTLSVARSQLEMLAGALHAIAQLPVSSYSVDEADQLYGVLDTLKAIACDLSEAHEAVHHTLFSAEKTSKEAADL